MVLKCGAERAAIAACAFLATLGMSQAASAATLAEKSGDVFVDKGKGYIPAQPNMGLAPGNVVMVQVGGSAKITFDGCTITIPFGDLYVIPQENPCAAANNVPGFDTGTIVVGVAVAGGVGAAIALSGGGGGGGSGGGGTNASEQ